MSPQPMILSAEDRDYLTALGPASMNAGPSEALKNAWKACLEGCRAACRNQAGHLGFVVTQR